MRKTLSVLLLLITVPALWLQIAAHTARSLLQDASFPKEVIRKAGVYDEVHRLLADQLAGNLGSSDAPVLFTQDEVRGILGKALPPARVQTMAETAIDGLYRWFRTGAARPEIVLDLKEVQTTLPGALRDVLAAKIEALPVCTIAQAADLVRTYRGGMPPCKTPDANINRTILNRALPDAQIQKFLPAKVDVAAELEKENGPQIWTQMNQSMARVRLAMNLVSYGWIVIAVLLALVALLNLDRWHTPLAWAGGALLGGGGAMLVLSMTAGSAVPTWLTGVATPHSPGDAVALSALTVAFQALFLGLRGISLTISLAGLAGVSAAMAGAAHDRQEAHAA